MEDYRPSLKIVGIALIALGVLDISLTIYSMAHDQGDSSTLSIPAVIAGILLLRGGLRTANIVAFLSALMLSGLIGMLIALPSLVSLDLLLAVWRVYPAPFVSILLLALCVLVLLGWIYWRLTIPPVMAAIADRYPQCTRVWRRPRTGFYVGILLVVLVAVPAPFMMRGTAVRAVAEAKQRVGDGYKFHASFCSMQSSGGRKHFAALVIAYNQKDIKALDIDWDE